MPKMFVNIDVGDLDKAVAFYGRAFELSVVRRLGSTIVELGGAEQPIFLLLKAEGTRPTRATEQTRDYRRHWTPVHLDFAVPELDAALARALAAGAVLEGEVETHGWGRIAYLADPFGHGLCLIQLSDEGYAALGQPASE